MSSVIAEGYNAFETEKSPTGVVKYLATPSDVLALVESDTPQDYIILVRGGTTTFLAPMLITGANGILTMSGAPESHLGILSREFQTPCVLSIGLTDSDSRYEGANTDEAHFGAIVQRLDGRRVRLDCQDTKVGRVFFAEDGA